MMKTVIVTWLTRHISLWLSRGSPVKSHHHQDQDQDSRVNHEKEKQTPEVCRHFSEDPEDRDHGELQPGSEDSKEQRKTKEDTSCSHRWSFSSLHLSHGGWEDRVQCQRPETHRDQEQELRWVSPPCGSFTSTNIIKLMLHCMSHRNKSNSQFGPSFSLFHRQTLYCHLSPLPWKV